MLLLRTACLCRSACNAERARISLPSLIPAELRSALPSSASLSPPCHPAYNSPSIIRERPIPAPHFPGVSAISQRAVCNISRKSGMARSRMIVMRLRQKLSALRWCRDIATIIGACVSSASVIQVRRYGSSTTPPLPTARSRLPPLSRCHDTRAPVYTASPVWPAVGERKWPPHMKWDEQPTKSACGFRDRTSRVLDAVQPHLLHLHVRLVRHCRQDVLPVVQQFAEPRTARQMRPRWCGLQLVPMTAPMHVCMPCVISGCVLGNVCRCIYQRLSSIGHKLVLKRSFGTTVCRYVLRL